MGLIVASWLLAVGDRDRRTGRLPNALLLPGVVGVLASGTPDALAAAFVATAPYLLAHALGAVGGGDVKLALIVGALVGTPAGALAAVLVAQAVALVGFRRAGPRRRPHGPALTGVAAVLVLGG
ncbi:MAG: A24 family peptidase [Gordonia sp. (in: high G+C Gram-positive bacteria)]|uniref:A24 family peptidase n=1 Tax=Gordonia sp. (in: high G+C Gram-positive bacteria) TaxID=84139 RepID=UPI0039E6BEBA